MFVDHARIKVKAGDGGNGCISFRREKFIPFGGPDGGDGGNGGDIVCIASNDVYTLMDFQYNSFFRAGKGHHGQGKKKSGSAGNNLEIILPIGTQIFDEAKNLIADLTEDASRVVVAQGGKGGKGNARFATSTRQAPRISEDGTSGEELTIYLELKLMADFALVGVPNAGKSTLIGAISDACPKIASYPFTTLVPNLGVVIFDDDEHIIVADIPGLIDGAHNGVGLGFEFLRHIERTKALIYVCDAAAREGGDPAHDLEILKNEIALYNREILDKPCIVVANKMDLPEGEQGLKKLKKACKGQKVIPLSAKEKTGTKELILMIRKIYDAWGKTRKK